MASMLKKNTNAGRERRFWMILKMSWTEEWKDGCEVPDEHQAMGPGARE